jgi:FkbH-like protein
MSKPHIAMKSTIDELLEAVDRRGSALMYTQAARQLPSGSEGLRSVRLSLLATYTISNLTPYVQVEATRNGFAVDIYVGNFNAVRQELLEPDGGCLRHQSEIVFVAQLLSDVCPRLTNDFLALTELEVEDCIEQTIAEFMACLETFRKHSQAAVVVHNFARPARPLLGIYEAVAPNSQSDAIRRLNQRLATSVNTVPGVYILDFDGMCAELGYQKWCDDKMWYFGRAPLAADALVALARLHAAFVSAIVGPPRKCLVLDLDNTLWGGVIGEDGISGIKLGHSYPGNVYQDIQRTILQLHRRGVLLAINSKNNPVDVDEVFRNHPEMILKAEHFASVRVNWQPKPQNMVEIANELNIGLEGLVFFDDSPAEREWMRKAHPQVRTMHGFDDNGRPDPLRLLNLLRECRAFDRLWLTKEDRIRGDLYRQQAARQRQQAISPEEFLIGLEMRVAIRPVDEFTFPRVVDLIQKTNQFNLTARRHSAAQLEQFLDDANCDVLALDVSDRFGDNGTVGVAVLSTRNESTEVDTLLLSCRVLGRTIETAFLHHLVDVARRRGATTIVGDFQATSKNAPAADFYARHGFTQIESNCSHKRWRLELKNSAIQWPAYIEMTSDEGDER